MTQYLSGILFIVLGLISTLANIYLFLQDYKFKLSNSSNIKSRYLLPNACCLLLSILLIVGGVIYIFMVNNQLQ